jgi:hypothetical protein
MDDPFVVHTQIVAQANAGAALAYAIYHCTGEFVAGLPAPVVSAYMRACTAYGIGAQYQVSDRATTVEGS